LPDKSIRQYDYLSGELLNQYTSEDNVLGMALLSEDKLLVQLKDANKDKKLVMLNLNTFDLDSTFEIIPISGKSESLNEYSELIQTSVKLTLPFHGIII